MSLFKSCEEACGLDPFTPRKQYVKTVVQKPIKIAPVYQKIETPVHTQYLAPTTTTVYPRAYTSPFNANNRERMSSACVATSATTSPQTTNGVYESVVPVPTVAQYALDQINKPHITFGAQEDGKTQYSTTYILPKPAKSATSFTPTLKSPKTAVRDDAALLASMLSSKETELEDKRIEVEDLRVQNRKLQEQLGQHSHSKEELEGESDDGELTQQMKMRAMQRRLDLLREERNELKELLLQKDRQLNALEGVDKSLTDTSAVQLGIQAINLAHGSVDAREELRFVKAELAALQKEKKQQMELLTSTFVKLTGKRQEAAELLELVSQRDMKVARVEAYLQQKSRELEILRESSQQQLEQERNKIELLEQELNIAHEQCASFKAKIAAKDEKVILLQGEIVRRDALLKQLEERVQTLSNDLTTATTNLKQLIASTAAKDAYMYELEAHLRKNDAERQAAYLAEVSRGRKIALELRLREDNCRAVLNEKNERLVEANQSLNRSEATLERIRNAILHADDDGSAYKAIQPLFSGNASHHTHPPRSEKFEVPIVRDIPAVPIETSLKALGAEIPFKATDPTTFSADILNSRQTTMTAEGAYHPVPSDSVDVDLGQLLSTPKYAPLWPQFCRLAPNMYVFGTSEVGISKGSDGVLYVVKNGKTQTLTSLLDSIILPKATSSIKK